LDGFPVNASGKLDRKALPEPEIGSSTTEYIAPRTAAEYAVATAFAEVIGVERVGILDNFFDLGGNSLLATRVVNVVGATLGTAFPLQWMFTDPTPQSLGQRVQQSMTDGALDNGAALEVLLPIRPRGEEAPLFCVHPFLGLAWSYAGLGHELRSSRPLYGLQSPVLTGEAAPASIAEYAARYIREIRAIQPHGPYHLAGWSLGGVIAHEMAVQFQEVGEDVAILGILDSYVDVDESRYGAPTVSAADMLAGFGVDLSSVDEVDPDVAATVAGAEARGESEAFDPVQAARLLARLGGPLAGLTADQLSRIHAAATSTTGLLLDHRPGIFEGDVVFFEAATDGEEHPDPEATWSGYVGGDLAVHRVAATHWTMTAPEPLAAIAPNLDPEPPSREPGPDDSSFRVSSLG
ncbi:Thioesterase domain-containing protein, partial [Rhodococcus triatomae]